MSTPAPRLGMKYNWADREGGYGGEYNVDVVRRDTFFGMSLLSVTTMAEPGSPTHGDAYYNPVGSTGTFWSIPENQDKIVVYLNEKPINPAPPPGYTPVAGWVAFAIPRGMMSEVQDSADVVQFYYGFGIWSSLAGLVGGSVAPTPDRLVLRDGSGGGQFAGVLTVVDILGNGGLNLNATGPINIRPTGSGGAGQTTTVSGGGETGGGPTGDLALTTLAGHYGSGDLYITTADALVDGDGGDIIISAGDAANLIHNGGKIRMKFGKRDVSGVDGNMTVTDGYGNLQLQIALAGTSILNLLSTTVPTGQMLSITDAPTSALHVPNKAYVDGVAQGLDVKASVRVIATANLTLSGLQTVDGVSLSAGDRVLAAGQTTASARGIYVVASGAWTRATDADTSAKVTSGMFTFVTEGTANAKTGWVLTTADPITLGSTSLTFTQFSGAGTYAAGTGITLTGNVFSVTAGTYQPLDAELTALAGLSSAANKLPRFTGSGTADLLDFDTDGTLTANSDTSIPSQKAVKTYVNAKAVTMFGSGLFSAIPGAGTVATGYRYMCTDIGFGIKPPVLVSNGTTWELETEIILFQGSAVVTVNGTTAETTLLGGAGARSGLVIPANFMQLGYMLKSNGNIGVTDNSAYTITARLKLGSVTVAHWTDGGGGGVVTDCGNSLLMAAVKTAGSSGNMSGGGCYLSATGAVGGGEENPSSTVNFTTALTVDMTSQANNNGATVRRNALIITIS